MKILVQYRLWFVSILLLLAAAVLPGLKNLDQPDNSLSVWFVQDDPDLKTYYRFQEEFGNEEVILLILTPEGGFEEPGFLDSLAELHRRLATIEGVGEVTSVWNTSIPVVSTEGIQIVPIVDPADGQLRFLDHPLVKDRLVDSSARTALVVIGMAALDDFDNQRDRIVQDVRAAVDDQLVNIPHYMGGVGVIYEGLNTITQRDFGLFISVGYLSLFVLLWFILRNARLFIASIGAISFSILVMLGVYGLAGYRLNMVSIVLPTLVLVIGIADLIHFPAALFHVRRCHPEYDSGKVAVAALREAFMPCLLTTITTVTGFMALLSSSMGVIQQMGIFAALGIGLAFLASLVTMAWALSGNKPKSHLPKFDWILRLLNRFVGQLDRRYRVYWILCGLALVGCILGASKLTVDTFSLGYLPDEHPVVLDHRAIEKHWGSYTVFDFLVRANPGKRIDDSLILAAMGSYVEQASKLSDIRNGFSLQTYHEALSQPEAALSPEAFSQVFETIRKSDPERLGLKHLMSEDGKVGRLRLTGSMMSAQDLAELYRKLDIIGEQVFDDLAVIEPAGYFPVYVSLIDHFMGSQIRSFFLALGLIFIVMLLALRSLRLALISLVPNFFPVLSIFAAMGFMGIHLDIATSGIAAMVLGISIDDTIHFLWAWRKQEQQRMAWRQCLANVYQRVGPAAGCTSLLLLIGYSVMMLGQVRTVVYFGLLVSIAAIMAVVADLLLLPLLLRLWPANRSESKAGSVEQDKGGKI